MKDYEYEAVIIGGEIFCVTCVPDGATPDDIDWNPIFAGDKVDVAPVCCECGQVHNYMNVLLEQEDDEL